MMPLHVEWDLLIQDAAPIGTLQAPLVSWLGVAGLLALCLWQTVAFLWRSRHLSRALRQFSMTLQAIAQERRAHAPHAAVSDPWTNRSRSVPREVNSRDLKDVHRLQAIVEQEPSLADAWTPYRHALITDLPPWYAEPRLFSSQPAADSFRLEPLLHRRIHLPSYQQLPSLLTGLGLLMTFIALLIGLSHLRAEGGAILGIQGLVNGLAGKFLTSIVGLVCAHAATFVEKHTTFTLAALHHTCVQHLDRLFPRNHTHDWLAEQSSGQARALTAPAMRPSGYIPALPPQAVDTLTQPVLAMTQAVTTLSQDLRALLEENRRPHESAPAHMTLAQLSPLLIRLTDAVETLTQQLAVPRPLPPHPAQGQEHPAEQLIARRQSAPSGQQRAQSWLRPIRALEQAWRS